MKPNQIAFQRGAMASIVVLASVQLGGSTWGLGVGKKKTFYLP